MTFALSLQCRWPGVPTSCGNATNPERMGSAGQCIFLRSVTGSHVSALRTLSVPTSICKLQPLWPSVRCGCGDSAFRRGGQQAGPGSHGSHPSTCSTRQLSLPSLRGLAPAPPDPRLSSALNVIVHLHALGDHGEPPSTRDHGHAFHPNLPSRLACCAERRRAGAGASRLTCGVPGHEALSDVPGGGRRPAAPLRHVDTVAMLPSLLLELLQPVSHQLAIRSLKGGGAVSRRREDEGLTRDVS